MSSHINVGKCILSLIIINDPLSYSILPTWFVLLFTLWLVSITFIVLLLKNHHNSVNANKKKFDSLMICASILSPITSTLVALMKLLSIHVSFWWICICILSKCHKMYFGCVIAICIVFFGISTANFNNTNSCIIWYLFCFTVYKYIITCIILCVMLRQRLLVEITVTMVITMTLIYIKRYETKKRAKQSILQIVSPIRELLQLNLNHDHN